MATNRRYKLLCPIARALDRVGDRWTLLILRDLHAGPARFADLKSGLAGIAPNILSDRLTQLTSDGLIQRREAEHGVSLYELTDLGMSTRAILFELAMFGAEFDADPQPTKPGNYRTIAVTLAEAAERVASPETTFEAEIVIEGEPYALRLREGAAEMRAGRPANPALTVSTAYEPMLAASEGDMPVETFFAEHTSVTIHEPDVAGQAITLMQNVFALLRGDAERT